MQTTLPDGSHPGESAASEEGEHVGCTIHVLTQSNTGVHFPETGKTRLTRLRLHGQQSHSRMHCGLMSIDLYYC